MTESRIQIRVCQACLFVYPRKGNKACPQCGDVYQVETKATAAPKLPALPWHIVNSRTRSFNNAGRYFSANYFAKKGWRLREHDADLYATGHANPLRVWLLMYSAKELDAAIRTIFSDDPDAAPSVTFKIWQEQMIRRGVEALEGTGQ